MIIIVASDFIPHIGGKSTHIMDLVSGLRENKESVLIFSQAQYSKIIRNIIKCLLYPIKVISNKLFVYCYNIIWSKLLSHKVLKLYKIFNPTCISVQDAFAAASLKNIRNKIKCPIVLTMHTYFGLENGLDCKKNIIQEIVYKRNYKFELKALEIVDKIISVDNRIKKHIIDILYKYNNARVKDVIEIENFTNTNIFSPVTELEKKELRKKLRIDENKFVIICARRLVEKNGVIFAVKAMKFIDDDNVLLLIAGDGPQYNVINDEINNDKDLKNKIKVLGSISSDKIVNLYKLADCSLVPSITVNGLQEATSISALEAMSCGLPTIASNIGGLKQIINNNKNGFLCEEKKPQEIANVINMLIKNVDLYRFVSEEARKTILLSHSHIDIAKKYRREFL